MKPSGNAKLQVILPVVKVRLEDLTYLKGLAEAKDGVTCRPSLSNSEHRLRILGLIANKELPPCPKAVRTLRTNRAKAKRELLKAIGRDDWSKIAGIPTYHLKQDIAPRIVTVVTPAGKALLARGQAQVDVPKGCK